MTKSINLPSLNEEQLASGHLYYANSLKMPKTGNSI